MERIRIYISLLFLLFISTLHAQNNTLDYYINQALSNSPLLKDYRNQVQSNGIDSALVRAGYKPHVIAAFSKLPVYGKWQACLYLINS